MRPIFSPTEYIQIKGRGTRTYTFKIGNTEYEKKHFFLLDFCAVAEYFEEKYDYSVPLKVPRETAGAETTGAAGGGERGQAGAEGTREGQPTPQTPREIPIWEGTDVLASREVIEVGVEGEKVDVMTFRGSFEQDVRKFAEQDADMQAAIADEDDDVVETLMNERFYHQPTTRTPMASASPPKDMIFELTFR
jgi:type I restriction enzyme R subunit